MILNVTTLPRYLGILISSDLSFHDHVIAMCKRAAIRANLILRAFSSSDIHLLFRAFVVYVRPMLEYCSEVWNPSDVHNVNLIENIQRNFTKRIFARTGQFSFTYGARLQSLKAQTLELTRDTIRVSVVNPNKLYTIRKLSF